MTGDPFQHVAVLGGGAWGTALAQAAALAGRQVTIWMRNADQAADMARTCRNDRRLPGIELSPDLHPTARLQDIAAADVVLLAVPAQTIGGLVTELAEILSDPAPIVLCAKGIDRNDGTLLSSKVNAALPGNPLCVLSGPTFAAELASGLPTAATLAAPNLSLADHLAAALGHDTFRLYTSDDVTGVELGGAVKNVLAIAAGAVMGMRLGANARAAMIARGLSEMRRLGHAMGARPDTMTGLSGLGDLVLSCTDDQSRNFRFGYAMGAGNAQPEELAEGVHTARALHLLAQRHNIDLPLASAVHAVLYESAPLRETVSRLLTRPPAREG